MTRYCVAGAVVDFEGDSVPSLPGSTVLVGFDGPASDDRLAGAGTGAFIPSSSSSIFMLSINPLILDFKASPSSPWPCHVGGTVSASLNTPLGLPETSRRFLTRPLGSEADGSWITRLSAAQLRGWVEGGMWVTYRERREGVRWLCV